MSKRPVLFTTPQIVDALDYDDDPSATGSDALQKRQLATVIVHTALLYMLWRELLLTIDMLAAELRRQSRRGSQKRLTAQS